MTDHDTTAGLSRAREAGARVGLEVIDGVDPEALSTIAPEQNLRRLRKRLKKIQDAFEELEGGP
ncbi:MAG: hypothetical protein ACE5DK_09620, partial [Paracoccaceae bacterium]